VRLYGSDRSGSRTAVEGLNSAKIEKFDKLLL